MPPVPVFEPRKRPRQTRSQITVTALLDATQRLLLSSGYTDCSTNLVAEVAGVGIGSLYEYFPNKDALVAGLVEREADSLIQALSEAILRSLGKPLPEALEIWFGSLLDELEARRPLLLVLIRDFPYLNKLPAIVALPERCRELVALCSRRFGGQIQIPDNTATYHVLSTMFGSVFLTHVLKPSPELPRVALIDAMAEILMKALRPNVGEAGALRATLASSAVARA